MLISCAGIQLRGFCAADLHFCLNILHIQKAGFHVMQLIFDRLATMLWQGCCAAQLGQSIMSQELLLYYQEAMLMKPDSTHCRFIMEDL